ncbi:MULTISPECIES: hypothetical protein [Arthrobacter]|uniref:Uncharacterized protein n=1 Tax=Arthrobacter terricola TaxID=2547396 RepID=A0A4V2ZUK7_9MICC|nr:MULTISPECIES: hypothetical protein [Arthrobacter]MBT8159484.1 hypothetical protein [Arthrobacter sp. GN70]TDG01375.1 hypothetical protein E1809_02440 [Arthrobacter terricola]
MSTVTVRDWFARVVVGIGYTTLPGREGARLGVVIAMAEQKLIDANAKKGAFLAAHAKLC